MSKNMSNDIAIIPARGGSKRIPRKNIIDFNGKPIIAWTIEAALKSGKFNKVLVSTEDEEIAEVSRNFGADVPFLRDSSYDDHSPVSQASTRALIQAEIHWKTEYDNAVQLMANCPMRSSEEIIEFHDHFISGKHDFLISCFKFGWQNPWWAFKSDGKEDHEFIFPNNLGLRSQDLPQLYCPTGSIWMAKSKLLKETKTFYGENQKFKEIDWISSIDIDDYDDLFIAKKLAMTKLQK